MMPLMMPLMMPFALAVGSQVGFQPGPANADGPNCIAVVAHFEFVGEWRSLSDDINWTYKDAAHKCPEALEKMQVQHGLYVIPPEALEAEGIFLEQFLVYINRAHSGQTSGGLPSPRADGASALLRAKSAPAAVGGNGPAGSAAGENSGVPPTFYCIFTFREPRAADGSRRHTFREWTHVAEDGTRRSLLTGCAPDARTSREMLQSGTIDREAVAALACRVVSHFTRPYTMARRDKGQVDHSRPTYSSVLSESCPIIPESVAVFDFSTRECLREAGLSNARGQLILPIGDALQEPFWPEGLGINRGIHNALE